MTSILIEFKTRIIPTLLTFNHHGYRKNITKKYQLTYKNSPFTNNKLKTCGYAHKKKNINLVYSNIV